MTFLHKSDAEFIRWARQPRVKQAGHLYMCFNLRHIYRSAQFSKFINFLPSNYDAFEHNLI